MERLSDGVNWLGAWSLYLKEVRRFLRVPAQTVTGPALQALLFLVVFAVALDRSGYTVGGLPFLEFLAPGLVMMAVIQNAFANSSSSLVIAKINGTIADYLMAPLSPLELTAAIALGGLTRGVLVGAVVMAALWPFVPLAPPAPLVAAAFAVLAGLVLALLGILVGIWAEKMDQLAAATNFVVTPLAFLSGTFYSVAQLPEPFETIGRANPFFHMIDGFRFGMTGHADGSLALGAAVLGALAVGLGAACRQAFATGYRLKP